MKASLKIMAAGSALVASACVVSPEAAERSRQASAKELAEVLDGRTAGAPLRCIDNYRSLQMQVIDDQTIVYRDGRTVYVQHPKGGCPGIGIGGDTLVTRQYGVNELCEGDISQRVDLRTGMQGGACVFDKFIPYTKG